MSNEIEKDDAISENRPKIVKRGSEPKVATKIESPLMSMKEAAAYLGVSLTVIRRLVDEKAFKVIPLAGVIKIRRSTLDSWLEQSEVYRDDEEAFSGSKRFSRTSGQGEE